MARGKKKKVEPEKKPCSSCNKEKPLKDYYKCLNSKYFSDGLTPLCKQCVADMVDIEKPQTMVDFLKFIDKPFVQHLWEDCVYEYGTKAVGNYMRQINGLNQYKDASFDESMYKEEDLNKKPERREEEKLDNMEANKDYVITETESIVWFSEELKEKWPGYDQEDILRLEKFYADMMTTHDIKTPQHIYLLKLMCVLNLKMERALENDNVSAFQKYYDQYDKILKSAGFRPIDKYAQDDGSGLRSFSKIFEEVEKTGFIEPAPVEENQDIVDLTIMYILNYQLKLLDMQQLEEPPLDTPQSGSPTKDVVDISQDEQEFDEDSEQE